MLVTLPVYETQTPCERVELPTRRLTDGEFEDANGKPVTDKRFLDIVRSRAGRAAQAGSGTLKRTVLTSSLLQEPDAGALAVDGNGRSQSGALKGALCEKTHNPDC